jgi:hypothetical protein
VLFVGFPVPKSIFGFPCPKVLGYPKRQRKKAKGSSGPTQLGGRHAFLYHCSVAGVAQLVEQRIRNSVFSLFLKQNYIQINSLESNV